MHIPLLTTLLASSVLLVPIHGIPYPRLEEKSIQSAWSVLVPRGLVNDAFGGSGRTGGGQKQNKRDKRVERAAEAARKAERLQASANLRTPTHHYKKEEPESAYANEKYASGSKLDELGGIEKKPKRGARKFFAGLSRTTKSIFTTKWWQGKGKGKNRMPSNPEGQVDNRPLDPLPTDPLKRKQKEKELEDSESQADIEDDPAPPYTENPSDDNIGGSSDKRRHF